MKAKHTIARMKGLSLWQKILCALMAVLLLSLMVPNGLRANALDGDVENEGTDLTTEEVTTDEGTVLGEGDVAELGSVEAPAASNDWQLWPRLGSTIDFQRASYNSESTAGYFTEQAIDLTVDRAIQIILEKLPLVRGNLFTYLNAENGYMPQNEEELIQAIYDIDASVNYAGNSNPVRPDRKSYLAFAALLLSEIEETPLEGDLQENLSDALWVPEDFPLYPVADKVLQYINHIVLPEDIEPLGDNIAMDGSILYLYVTLGSKDSLQSFIGGTTVHLHRIIPIMPAYNPFTNANLLGAENDAAANAAAQNARFLNWEISYDGGKSFIPLTWAKGLVHGTIPIYGDSKYVFKANFFDLEGFTKVNIDFGTETRDYDLIESLYKDGWYTTGMAGYGQVWSKLFPEWTPKWLVYTGILEMLQGYATRAEDTAIPFKDQALADLWYDNPETNVFPGPHWVEVTNDDWYGTLAQDDTMYFSWYPVSPRGYVSHPQFTFIADHIGDSWKTRFQPHYPVSYADVMYYNEWGMPLFSYDDQYYGIDYEGDNYGYAFVDVEDYELKWCFDQQIDHVVIKAYGYADWMKKYPYLHSMDDDGLIYIPLRVDADKLAEMDTDFLFTSMANFNVEALMMGSFTPGFPAALDNYEVSYYEDGELLFDPLVLDNFWALQFFSMPMATGGTLSVDANGDLVSTFSAYFDYLRPWTAGAEGAFTDPDQFDPTPGVSHEFQCRIHANAKPGNMIHSWTYDYIFDLGYGQSMYLTDMIEAKIRYNRIIAFDLEFDNVFSPNFVEAASISAAGTEGHSAFHIDYFADNQPTVSYDFVGGTDSVFAGTTFTVQPDGTLRAVHNEGTLIPHNEGGVVTAVPVEGYQLASWTINGVDYPVGTSALAATATADSPTNIVANYVVAGGGQGGEGGGTAQTGDMAGFAFAILAMIAIAGAGILAGRKLYTK